MDINISVILSEARNYQPEIRKKAEGILENLAKQDFFEFLKQLVSELSDEEKSKENRQLAATIIKNMITYMDSLKNIWLNFPEEKSNFIKNAILSTLASKVKDVRRAAGHTIAGNNLKFKLKDYAGLKFH